MTEPTPKDLGRLLNAVTELARAQTLEDVIATVRQVARDLSGAEGVTFILRDGDCCHYVEENAIAPLWKGKRFPISACVSGWAMLHREAVMIPDIYRDDRVPVDAYRETFVRSLIMVPVSRDDPVAAIGAYWSIEHNASPQEVELLQALADATATALGKARIHLELLAARVEAEQRLEEMSHLYDKAQRENAERERAEAKFLLAIEAMPNAVVMIDRSGTIVLVNAQTEQLFGYRRHELLGQGVETLIPARFRDVHPTFRQLFCDSPQTRFMGAGRDLFGLRKDGTEFPVEIGLNPLQTSEGVFVLSAIVDITERKVAEQALKEQNRRKDEFLAMLAHELRNPLAPLRNGLYILGSNAADDAAREPVLSMMQRQIAHLARLVDDLLDVSRISRGKIVLQMERLDLARLVANCHNDHHMSLSQSQIRTVVTVPDVPIWVMGDQTRLSQIVDNLIGNAIKFTDAGGQISILLECDRGSHSARLTIADTGIGIESEMLDRMFEPFAQADRSLERSRGGLGIGLSLVKGLVELHGGSVGAQSGGRGHGASFTVNIPLCGEPPALLPLTIAKEKALRPERILIVEDHRDSADSLRILLESKGHIVEVSTSGLAGVECARRFLPTIVLCDIGLPGMDGFAVAHSLRTDPRTASARIIAITGYGQDHDRMRSRKAGFDLHLVKPVDPESLLKQIYG